MKDVWSMFEITLGIVWSYWFFQKEPFGITCCWCWFTLVQLLIAAIAVSHIYQIWWVIITRAVGCMCEDLSRSDDQRGVICSGY